MSAVIAFTAPQALQGDDYIDEPCSKVGNVRGSYNTDNVTYVNFLPAAPAPTPLRLTKRGRRVLATFFAAPIVIAAFAFALNGGGATATAELGSNDFSYVTVASGQSLWQLAEEIAPQADPRDFIAEIVSLNQIQGEIQPGQRLAIPVGY